MAKSAIVGALRVILGIDTAQFEEGLKRVEKQLSQVGKRMQAIGRQMSTAITAPLTLAGGAALSFAADFEAAMSRARAVLRPTQAEFKALSDLALELGRTTKFTAAEAADGIEMLGRNGLKAADILNGAATATLHLASAAGAELAPAADVMTDIMVNFRMTGEQLVSTVDNIAGTLVNSKLAWDDYAQAVGQAAGVAGPMGLSFEDMNAALALTASSFSSGVEAGTSFKNMLMYLAPTEKKARDLIKQLGLEFFDAGGRLRTLAEIAEELRTKLGGLTREAQLQVLGVLFGARSIRSAIRLMEEGAEGVNRIKQQIAEVSAAEMAAARLDNLRGSLLMLKSAVEGLAIAIANAGILEWARKLVDWLTEVTRAAIDTNPAILRLIAVVSGVAAAVGPALLALGLLASAIGAIGVPVAGMITAISAAGAAVAAFWPEIQQAARFVSLAFGDIYHAAKKWLVDSLSTVIDWVLWGFGKIRDAVIGLARILGLDDILARVRSAVESGTSAVGGSIDGMVQSVKALWRQAGEELKREAEMVALESADAWKSAISGVTAATDSMAARFRPPVEGTGTLEAENATLERRAEIQQRLNELQQYANQLQYEGQALTESLRTPQEELMYRLQRIAELQQHVAISAETAAAAQVQAQAIAANAYLGLASQIAGAAQQIFGKSKLAAIASAIVNTAQAVTRTLAQYGGTPWGWAQAAAAAASGAAQIATIRSTNIGSGGRAPSVRGGGSAGGGGGEQARQAQLLQVQGLTPQQLLTGDVVRSLAERLLDFQRDGGEVVFI